MPFTNQWDVTQPPDTQLANLLGQDIRNLKLDIQQRLVLSGLAAALPPLGTDAQPTNWTGMLYFATDTGQIFRWNGSAWIVTTSPFALTSYFNASCSVGLSIPGGSLVTGNVVEIIASVTQSAGGAGCALNSPIVGGLPLVIPSNGGPNPINWTVFCRVFMRAVGLSGGANGYYISASGVNTATIVPVSLQDVVVNTNNPIGVGMTLGLGNAPGPISVKII